MDPKTARARSIGLAVGIAGIVVASTLLGATLKGETEAVKVIPLLRALRYIVHVLCPQYDDFFNGPCL